MSSPRPTTGTAAPAERCAVDKERIAAAVREILEAIGEDPAREGLRETPRRIAEMYEEILGGLAIDPTEYLGSGSKSPTTRW